MNDYDPKHYFKDRCILTMLNDDVRNINDLCMQKFKTNTSSTSSFSEHIYKSDDSVGLDEIGALYSKEYLNEREFNGIPVHKMKLKIGVPVMLLRNIDPPKGLCNGTRLIVQELHEKLIKCTLMHNPTQVVWLNRMFLSPPIDQIGYEFKRRQFPITLAFAMTINKSQGQTMKHTAIYLPKPVFEHGQLYVAVSRVTTPENLKIFLQNATHHGYIEEQWITLNIVHKQLLI